tara:strand:- start:27231 stop:28127 length:897 start_codon:yes stop_codon:yes gene_type:complete
MDNEFSPRIDLKKSISEIEITAGSSTPSPTLNSKYEDENIPKTVLFILNRNGLDEDKLRSVLEVIIESEYAADDVFVEWVSIFGAFPERPHAFVTLSDNSIAEEMIETEICEVSINDTDYKFEFSQAEGILPNNFEDPISVFITGIDTTIDPDIIEKDLYEICDQIAPAQEIIFPRNWIELGNVIITFPNPQCASIFARVAKVLILHDKFCKISYARRRPDVRTSPLSSGRGSRKNSNQNTTGGRGRGRGYQGKRETNNYQGYKKGRKDSDDENQNKGRGRGFGKKNGFQEVRRKGKK